MVRQGRDPSKGEAMSKTIRGYHGGGRDGARWFYLGDAGRDAAGWFGDVHEAEITIVDATTEDIGALERGHDLYVAGGGMEQDAALYEYMESEGLDALIIRDFEEGADAILLSEDSARSDMTWRD